MWVRLREWKSEFKKCCESLKKVVFYKHKKLSYRRRELKKKVRWQIKYFFPGSGEATPMQYTVDKKHRLAATSQPQLAHLCICIIENVTALASSQYWAKCYSCSWEFVFHAGSTGFFFFVCFFPGWGHSGVVCGVGVWRRKILWVLFWILVNKKAGNLPACYSDILKHDTNCLDLKHRRCWKVFLRRSWNI